MKTRVSAKQMMIALSCFLFSAPAFAARYEVAAKTCDLQSAGTDSEVLFEIMGERGNSLHHLGYTPNRNDFARDQVDSYEVSTPDLGALRWLRVTMPGTDGWCMQWVRLRNLDTGRSWFWRYNSWIDTNSEYPATVLCKVGEAKCR